MTRYGILSFPGELLEGLDKTSDQTLQRGIGRSVGRTNSD